MHRFARLTIKQDAKLENEAAEKPKKTPQANRISNIATLDNGTMVEAFKFLNYCQLAKNSLVSNRFLDVIRTHRDKLAILYVHRICMERNWDLFDEPAVIKIFNKKLSPGEYDEWVVRNNYSKQISLSRQGANDPSGYELSAYGDYNGPNQDRMSVFLARVKELDHEIWPLFEHFVRLLTDPFVSIRKVKLTQQIDVSKLWAATINRNNRGRLQCEKLVFNCAGTAQKSFNSIKDNVCCLKFRIIVGHSSIDREKQLLDFFATGSHCTSKIVVIYSDISKAVIIDLVQKFMDLKNSDESQMVELICGYILTPTVEALKSNYAKFVVNEKQDRFGHIVFEIVNADIGKKLQVIANNYKVKLEIKNL